MIIDERLKLRVIGDDKNRNASIKAFSKANDEVILESAWPAPVDEIIGKAFSDAYAK